MGVASSPPRPLIVTLLCLDSTHHTATRHTHNASLPTHLLQPFARPAPAASSKHASNDVFTLLLLRIHSAPLKPSAYHAHTAATVSASRAPPRSLNAAYAHRRLCLSCSEEQRCQPASSCAWPLPISLLHYGHNSPGRCHEQRRGKSRRKSPELAHI